MHFKPAPHLSFQFFDTTSSTSPKRLLNVSEPEQDLRYAAFCEVGEELCHIPVLWIINAALPSRVLLCWQFLCSTGLIIFIDGAVFPSPEWFRMNAEEQADNDRAAFQGRGSSLTFFPNHF